MLFTREMGDSEVVALMLALFFRWTKVFIKERNIEWMEGVRRSGNRVVEMMGGSGCLYLGAVTKISHPANTERRGENVEKAAARRLLIQVNSERRVLRKIPKKKKRQQT